MKIKIITIVFFVAQFNYGQINTDLRPQLKSPEVTKFEQYTNMPVNLVSGTPQVSIPIYTLEYGGMILPITLEYDASGVKVESIASSVGQNWSLNVGGTVSRIVKGAPDEGNPYQNATPTSLSLNCRGYYRDFGLSQLDTRLNSFAAPPNVSSGASQRFTAFNIFCKDLAKGYVDSQPDLFSFYTPEGGGKFVFNDQRTVVYLENTDLIIKENTDTAASHFKSWTVTAPTGRRYKFGLNTGNFNGFNNEVERSYSSGSGFDITNHFIVNSWFLTEVSNYNNDKKIQIEYVANNYTHAINVTPHHNTQNTSMMPPNAIAAFSEESQYRRFTEQNMPVYAQNHVESKLISKIKTDTAEIIFYYSNRSDLQSTSYGVAQKLDRIEIIEKMSGNLNSRCIKKFLFNYDDISASDIHANTGTFTQTVNRRMFLNSVVESDCADVIIKPYLFTYDTTSLPNKLSFAQDKWGFYNGMSNNVGLMPPYRFFQNSLYYANRSVQFSFAKAGTLEQIKYPTKGSVNFEYEPHQSSVPTDYYYDPVASSHLLQDFQHQAINGSYPPRSTTFVYNLNSNQVLSLTSNLMFPNPVNTGLLYWCAAQSSGPQIAVEIIDTTTNSHISRIDYTELPRQASPNAVTHLSKTVTNYIDPEMFIFGRTYKLTVYGSQCYFNIASLGVHNVTPIYDVGGLRIKKIAHINDNGSIAKEKEYTYAQPNVVMNNIKAQKVLYNYVDSLESWLGLISYSNILHFRGQAYSSPTFGQFNSGFYYYITAGNDPFEINFRGPHISYATVTETDGNGSTLNLFNRFKSYFELNGYTIPKQFPAPPKFQSLLAGEKTSIFQRDLTANVLREIIYDYNYATTNTNIKGIISNNIFNMGFTNVNSYSIQGQIKTLKSETETVTLNGIDVVKTEEYEYNYNNVAHNQPTKITLTDGQGNNALFTNMYYPKDVPSEPNMSTLIAQNKIGAAIKTETFRGAEKLSEQIIKYGSFSSTVAGSNYILPQFVYSKKGDVIPDQSEKKVTYNYNINGNLIEYTPESGLPVTIIWGYNKTQPIAKIENATYTSIQSYEVNLQTLSNTGTEPNLIIALNTLRANLPNAMVTTYTHKPLVGVSTITDPKGNQITYTYDSFGRLQYVKDKDGNTLSENQYHYKN